ncbi:MAG: hypothetical protein AB1611_02430 [bacterium]
MASRRLVIDASVARSAGGDEATNLQSQCCRNFLQSILDICHRMVMTPQIISEWNRHQSNFARMWRVSMMARRKVDFLNDIQNSELSEKIKLVAVKENDVEAMLKDFHLIEAALASERTIISLDEIVKKLFAAASGSIGELKNVVWVNPAKEDEHPIIWLQDGAKAEKDRQLG